jgi:hypothetical protein
VLELPELLLLPARAIASLCRLALGLLLAASPLLKGLELLTVCRGGEAHSDEIVVVAPKELDV